jgi:glycosyltransferase involved in cell wall biosynthesis
LSLRFRPAPSVPSRSASMHVVQVNYVYEPGLEPEALLERYTTLVGWSEALLSAGASRASVGQRFGRDLDLERNGVTYRFRSDGAGPFPRPWTRPAALERAIAGLDPDVVHFNGLGFPAQLPPLRRRLPGRAPLLIQDHKSPRPRAAGRLSPASLLRRWLWRRGLARADGFLFTAREQARPWIEAGLIAEGPRVFEVPEASRDLPRRAAGGAPRLPGRPALLWVGRLDRNKDPSTVLDGLERALARLPGAQLTMAFTDEALLPEVRARLAASPPLAARVHLRGALPPAELPRLYEGADLFVLGSHDEGSGYALIEALACGVVPVVTDIPSFRALTGGGRLGRLWSPGDAAAFAAALADAAALDLLACGRDVAAHFERELSWAAVGRRALAAYRDAADRRAAASATLPGSAGRR